MDLIYNIGGLNHFLSFFFFLSFYMCLNSKSVLTLSGLGVGVEGQQAFPITELFFIFSDEISTEI